VAGPGRRRPRPGGLSVLHLRRVHFASVGHRDARLAPLTLALVGEDGRPSHSVLWLRNGGGKSSMLNLLFAVLRPGRREFLGNDDSGKDRALADYVLPDDTAHVVLEWGLPGERGAVWVTGMVLEWRDRARSADLDRLRRLWYGFVPTPLDGRLLAPDRVLTLDTLPIVEAGTRLSLARYRDRLREAGTADPGLELVVTDVQAEWRRALEQRRLDPEAFRYQLQMNREEGGASQLFKRRSRTSGAFVDLLLELVLPDEQPGRVAAVFGRYADELARRPELERNRDFLAGALERVRPVADAMAERHAGEERLAAAVGAAARVAASLAGAAEVADEAAAAAAGTADRLVEAARLEEAARAALLDQAAAAAHAAAALRVAAAERDLDQVRARADEAAAGVRAWRVADVLAALRAAEAEVDALAAQLATVSDDLAPVRAERDGVGRALSARLAADEAAAGEAAAAAAARAAAADAEAETVATDRGRLAGQHGRLTAELSALRARRAAAAAERAAAERDGLVDRGEDPAAALRRVRDERAACEGERASLADRAAALRDGEARLDGRAARLDAAAPGVAARLAAARAALADLEQRCAALARDPRVLEVAEVAEAVLLEEAGAALAERLAELAEGADRRLLEVELEAAADRRALAALDDDGLLPPRPDVAAVRAVLDAGGVTAQPGWRWLADAVPADRHGDVLAAAPEAVDGVVVPDPADLPRARALLDAAGLRPAAAVVVTPPPPVPPTGGGRRGRVARDGAAFVVPPAPALSDRVAGEAERAARVERLDGVDQRAARLRAARDRDAALAERLRAFLAAYPAPVAARVRSQHDEAVAADRALADDRAAVRAERDELRAAVRDLDDRRAEAARRAVALERAVADLERLAARTVEDRADAERAVALTGEIADTSEALVALGREEHEHRAAARAARDDAAAADAAARRVAERRSDLALPPPVEDADPAPDDAAEALERRWRVLDERYRSGVGRQVLAERHRRAVADRNARLADLAGAPAADRAAAAALLGGPEGADRTARAAALAAAEARHDDARAALGRAQERVRATRAELVRTPAPSAALPEEPEDAPAAERLAGRLAAQAGEGAEEALALRRRAAEEQRTAAERHQDAERLRALVERLETSLAAHAWAEIAPDRDALRPFAADAAAARAAADQAQAELRAAATAAAASGRRADAAEAELRRFVLDRRFDVVDGPLRDRLGRDPVRVLADRAGDYAADMEVRLAQCSAQLGGLDAHRDLLVRELADRVDEALHLLRQAERASTLPDGFGDWSGQQFLHVRYDRVGADEELFARLAELVDAMVERGDRPEGLPLVQQAAAVAVGTRGFSVRILKPNAALRTERVPVSDLPTFSGGEQLTAAVLLYCTLSQLRARLRGRRGTGGVLVLDNPIGKSSNVTLLDLQRRVADGLGVQLVYTTAVDDRDAIAALPNRIRLRNERSDRATGNHHVEVEQDDAARPGTAPVAHLTATRIWRRPDERDAADTA